MGTATLGDAVLTWDAKRATLERQGTKVTASVSRGRLADRPLDVRGARGVLASREAALLADGEVPSLVEAVFVQEILAARVVGGAAGLVGRERVELRAFASGAVLASENPGGASRPALIAVVPDVALAVPFHDSFALLAAGGGSAVHLVQADFPLLKALAGRVLAAGRDRIVLADAANPSAVAEQQAQGEIQHSLLARGPDLAGLPSRDHLYVVDALAGRIHERPLEGEILSVTVSGGVVRAKTGAHKSYAFDRDGNPAS